MYERTPSLRNRNFIQANYQESVYVDIRESIHFAANTYDKDEDDNITATLKHNDNGLFEITSVYQNSFGLSFAGVHVNGTWKGQMVISDEKVLSCLPHQ